MLVAGEETNASLRTWSRAAAAQQSSGSERVERKRDTERGKEESGRMRQRTAKKKRTGFLWGVFQFLSKFVFFYFSFSPFKIFYSC